MICSRSCSLFINTPVFAILIEVLLLLLFIEVEFDFSFMLQDGHVDFHREFIVS